MNLKKIFIPIIISIIFGYVSGNIVYNIYQADVVAAFNQKEKIYLLQVGAYKTIESMKNDNINLNYVYFNEDGYYKVIVGITKKNDNINKIKSLYDREYLVKEYYSNDSELNQKIDDFDNILSTQSDSIVIKQTVKSILNLYNNNLNQKLIANSLD